MDLKVEFLPGYAGPIDWRPAREGDAGLDLYASNNLVIPPGGTDRIHAGIRIEIPWGYEGQVRPKSGRALKEGLTVLNTPGTIDAGYRGEIIILAHNANPVLAANDWVEVARTMSEYRFPQNFGEKHLVELLRTIPGRIIRIERGQKVAQIVFSKFEHVQLRYGPVGINTERGEGGAGSTGLGLEDNVPELPNSGYGEQLSFDFEADISSLPSNPDWSS